MMEELVGKVIVTRHPALVRVLREIFPSLRQARVITHATPEDVAGEHVFGVLPMHLATLADKVTVINLNIPPELRGVELTEDQVREYLGEIVTYRVSIIPSPVTPRCERDGAGTGE